MCSKADFLLLTCLSILCVGVVAFLEFCFCVDPALVLAQMPSKVACICVWVLHEPFGWRATQTTLWNPSFVPVQQLPFIYE